ncbi:hypothetical protein SAY87_004188 [Trapa incisa]|uniref:Uncharacterized protein n=1 Tax=Trapa incisa TaxID=236973 RepID=A0AAN7PLG4_9MYRT|nr:hypothetical protein SAY87_004188 [Trapa incisa]
MPGKSEKYCIGRDDGKTIAPVSLYRKEAIPRETDFLKRSRKMLSFWVYILPDMNPTHPLPAGSISNLF